MKKKKLQNHYGGYMVDSEFFKMTDREFVDWCGGRIAIGLFKGTSSNDLFDCICLAQARGMKRQAEIELDKSAE